MLKIYERLQGEIAAVMAPTASNKKPKAAPRPKAPRAADLATMEMPKIHDPPATHRLARQVAAPAESESDEEAAPAPKPARKPRVPKEPKEPKAPRAPRAAPAPKAAPPASNAVIMNAPVRVGKHVCICEVWGKTL